VLTGDYVYRFLLVSLNIDAILGEVTISQRRKKLQAMARGNGLGDAYEATLTRLKAQKGNKSELGSRALMWVLNSRRPLSTDDLCKKNGDKWAVIDKEVCNGIKKISTEDLYFGDLQF